MSDTPLFDATLSDQLHRVRRQATEQVAAIQRLADERIAAAEQRVRTALALSAPPLPALRVEPDEEEPFEREAPPIPSMAELLRPTPGINRFLDSLLGVPEP